MDRTWLIYTGLTVVYIVILVLYFLRRSKSHEKELENFIELAQTQLDAHKAQVTASAQQKVTSALTVVKKVQQAASAFEQQAQAEYDQIIEDAQQERRELLAKTKNDIDQLYKQADKDLDIYRQSRQQEIERNLVKLVMSVTEKVVEVSLNTTQHKQIIFKALDEIKQKQVRN